MICVKCKKNLIGNSNEDIINHLEHCIWCQEMDDKLLIARNYYYREIDPKKIIFPKTHP